jgi:hypothetical protein
MYREINDVADARDKFFENEYEDGLDWPNDDYPYAVPAFKQTIRVGIVGMFIVSSFHMCMHACMYVWCIACRLLGR